MATKIASKGTQLQLSISAVYTTIASITDIDGPTAETQTFKPTTLDGGVGIPTKTTGYVDGGTVSCNGYFDPVETTHQACTDLLTTPAVSSWKIIWSDSATTTWAFSGVLTGFNPSASTDDGLKFSMSIAVDGIPTYPT